jgi:hypothetical protein
VAIDQRVDREVTTQANVVTNVEFCAALTNDDRARFYFFAAKALYAKTLTL